MAKEELLDAIIYVVADYIRNVRSEGERAPLSFRKNDEPDDNKLIMSVIDYWDCVESPQHKMLLWNLFKMLNSDIFCSSDWKYTQNNATYLICDLIPHMKYSEGDNH